MAVADRVTRGIPRMTLSLSAPPLCVDAAFRTPLSPIPTAWDFLDFLDFLVSGVRTALTEQIVASMSGPSFTTGSATTRGVSVPRLVRRRVDRS